jgi:hypothetical protein
MMFSIVAYLCCVSLVLRKFWDLVYWFSLARICPESSGSPPHVFSVQLLEVSVADVIYDNVFFRFEIICYRVYGLQGCPCALMPEQSCVACALCHVFMLYTTKLVTAALLYCGCE